MTERLFWQDPYAREFTARVVRRTARGLVLDRTLFYPTGGGQPHDTGTINGVRVADVVEEGDDIVHVLEGEVPVSDVKGSIDWDRRLDHMQQHDGQHILSEAFVRVCGAETASFHLGREICTIDLDKADVTARHAEEAEALANRVVWENRPITAGFFSREEAAKRPLRKPPQVEGRIRIVEVRDFDACACCGTHAKSSGETGVILVVGVERRKADSRVSFVCGRRALAYAREDIALLREAGGRLSASRTGVPGAVERVMAEAAEARKALAAAEKQLAEHRGRELAAAAPARGRARFAVEVFENRDLKYLQTVANIVVASSGLVAILGGTGEASSVVLARSKDVEVDLRPIAKEVFAVVEGRGGGQPHFVQGGGPGRNVREALRLAEERIAAHLG
ncbi:MAG: alanyl-tRNA editing protein [Planctomycetes bacterium]|nr:alanyl-tRNA editing protein [Planctomycetota bacterium]